MLLGGCYFQSTTPLPSDEIKRSRSPFNKLCKLHFCSSTPPDRVCMPTTTRCQFQFQFDGNCPAQSPNYVENFSFAQFVEFNYTLDSHNLLSTYSRWPTVYVCCFSFNWGRFRYLPTSLALSRRCSAPVNNGTAELGTAHSSIISLGDDNHPASSPLLYFVLPHRTNKQ